jgi:hypothetical protein
MWLPTFANVFISVLNHTPNDLLIPQGKQAKSYAQKLYPNIPNPLKSRCRNGHHQHHGFHPEILYALQHQTSDAQIQNGPASGLQTKTTRIIKAEQNRLVPSGKLLGFQ